MCPPEPVLLQPGQLEVDAAVLLPRPKAQHGPTQEAERREAVLTTVVRSAGDEERWLAMVEFSSASARTRPFKLRVRASATVR